MTVARKQQRQTARAAAFQALLEAATETRDLLVSLVVLGDVDANRGGYIYRLSKAIAQAEEAKKL